MANRTLSNLILIVIAMIEKSQVLSTVQQIQLRKLELEVEALREKVQHQSYVKQGSSLEANTQPSYKPTSQTLPHFNY